MEEIDEVPIFPDFPEHKVQIGVRLDDTLKEQIISFFGQNHDCFAWSHEDITGIDPEIAVHRLQVDPDYRPVKHK